MATPSNPRPGKPKTGKAKGSKPKTTEPETVEANIAAAKTAAKTVTKTAAKPAKPKSAKPAAAQAPASDATVVSLKVTLNGTKPPIWRRLLVPTGMTLGHLHLTLQSAMGWENCHLHAFDIGGQQYGDPEEAEGFLDEGDSDENLITVGDVVTSGISKFVYTYDFGDDWEHVIAVEKTQPAVAGAIYPHCVAGKRACPPEDCGGPWGYLELLDILADPKHPEYAGRREWLDEDFDPEEFDMAGTNAVLAARFGQR